MPRSTHPKCRLPRAYATPPIIVATMSHTYECTISIPTDAYRVHSEGLEAGEVPKHKVSRESTRRTQQKEAMERHGHCSLHRPPTGIFAVDIDSADLYPWRTCSGYLRVSKGVQRA